MGYQEHLLQEGRKSHVGVLDLFQGGRLQLVVAGNERANRFL